MVYFNPRYMTSIERHDDDVKLRSSSEQSFQRYVYEKFKEKGCINRSRKAGYTLAYGEWNDKIHRNWFLPNISWHGNELEWVLKIKIWLEDEEKLIWIKKRPDFIFVKNKSNASAPNVYVIWEVKKAWLKCGSQRCQESGEHDNQCRIYRYCVNPSSGLFGNEKKIRRHDSDYENRSNLPYRILRSNSLDGLMIRAEEQAKEYADMLSELIPNANAMICYRSVIFVLHSRRNPNIFEVEFGDSKTL